MRALVRPTSRRLADGQLTHIDRVEVDIDLAERQWGAYCDALDTWGFEPVRVAAADDLPDSVFVEDAVVVFDGIAVLTSPGAESRRGETDAVAETLRRLGMETAAIELPGTLDGGDVLKIGRTVYVGQGGRTNGDGIRQLRSLLAPRGYTVVGVPVTKVLHLKSAVTALPDGTVIGHPDDVDHPEVFERFLPMPEHGAAVVVLDASTVLMAASVPESAALVEHLGYRVLTVDISEFEKLEGCVTCLSVRLRD
jgi:dimethylargininase